MSFLWSGRTGARLSKRSRGLNRQDKAVLALFALLLGSVYPLNCLALGAMEGQGSADIKIQGGTLSLPDATPDISLDIHQQEGTLSVPEVSLDVLQQEPPVQDIRTFFCTLPKASDWSHYLGTHLRTSYNTFNNTVDLDSRNHSDKNNYLAYVYDFTVDLRHTAGPEIYAFVEKRGRADYDAPLWTEKPLNTVFGQYHTYVNTDMFPRLREFWMDMPLLPAKELSVKGGLYPYGREIGHRIALGGKYENWGLTVSGQNEFFDWNFHWEKEDINNRIHLGKVIDFDKVVGYNDTFANFFAWDGTIKYGKQRLQLYTGWLRDHTSEFARSSLFTSQVKNEDLITPGLYADLHFGKLGFGFEGARNIGTAYSADKARFHDVKHEGYMCIWDAKVDMGSFKPKAKLFMMSGNKANEIANGVFAITSDRNRAFSVFSPLNTNLFDTHYQKQFGPYVSMAGGYSTNFGVARPGTFGDPFVFENLVAPTVGFDYTPLDKVYFGMDYWYLRSKENGFGLDEFRRFRKYPKELGHEMDFFASYQWTKNVKLSLLSGVFFPGKYYKNKRSDPPFTNAFSPAPRTDGDADAAFQFELAMDVNF